MSKATKGRPHVILFTHTSSLIGGGNKVLLSLFERLDTRRYEAVSILPEPGPMEDALRCRAVAYKILDIRPNKGRVRTATAVFTLATQIVHHKARLIHANDPFTYRASSLAARATRTPIICHVHHPDQDRTSIAWAFACMPTRILTPTQYVKNMVCEWLGNPQYKQIHVVGNPVDVEWFSPSEDVANVREMLGMKKDSAQLTIIGAITSHKGHESFLRAAQRILRRHPAACFNIVGSTKSGDKKWAEQIETLVHELDIQNAVRFWGFLPDATTRDVLSASDLLVLPTTLEGFGLVVAEALSCRVPVITSSIPPLDEIVTDGKSGFLVSPMDYEQIAHRACELLESPEKRREFGVFGRNYVIERFCAQSVVDRIVEHYDAVMSGRG